MRSRRSMILAACIVIASVACAPGYAANVALNKPVTITGTIHNSPSLVVDGVFLNRGTSWTSGSTLWWNGLAPTIEIDLQGLFQITGLVVQADDNDAYRLEYKNAQGSWVTGWGVPNYDPYGSGLQTRPDPANNATQYIPSAPFLASALRLSAASGDNCYSISEVQAFGQAPAVPELPASVLAMIPGVFALIGSRLRRR